MIRGVPWLVSPPSVESPRVLLGTAADASVIEVPLVRGGGDPRPRVEVWVDETHRALAVLDLAGSESRCGWRLAAELGIPISARSEVATLRIGEVIVRDLPITLGRGDELVLGLGGWTEAGVAVLASRGVVRFGDDPDAVMAEIGPPIPVDRSRVRLPWRERGALGGAWSSPLRAAVPVRLDGAEAAIAIDTSAPRSTLGFGVASDRESLRGGVPRVEVALGLGGEVPATFGRDESDPDPRPGVVGVLGADLLATADLSVGPSGVAVRWVADPCWTDAGAVRRAWLEAAEAPTDADGWEALAAARFAAGDYAGAAAADLGLRPLVAERCELGLALALRAARSPGPTDPSTSDGVTCPGPDLEPPYRWTEARARAVGGWRSTAARARGSAEVAAAWRPSPDDPHPLTTALGVPLSAVRAALVADPGWTLGRLLIAPDELLAADVVREAARRPGDPGAECLRALVTAAPIPDLPSADCVAARLSRAASSGDHAGVAAASDALGSRWPDTLFDEPSVITGRLEGGPMIPWLLATSASADGGSFDHTHAEWAGVLAGAVSTSGAVDYAAIGARRARLDGYLAQVSDADPTGWSSAQKLAFYVNAYNAYTVRTVLDAGSPASIRDLDGGKVWDTRKFGVAGRELTLNQIENGEVRPLGDGRVHAVLNCASKGCPPLPPAPVLATSLEAQLDEGARRWARTNGYTLSGSSVGLSQVFDWYAADFTDENRGDIPGVDGNAENALWFLSRFVDEPTRARLVAGGLTSSWTPYDWSLNRK